MEHRLASVYALRDAVDVHAREARGAERAAKMWREIAVLAMVAAFFQWVIILLFVFARPA